MGRLLFGCLHVVGAQIVVFIPLPAEYWSPIGGVAAAADNRAVDDASQLAWAWAATGTSWRIHHDGRLPRAAAERARALMAADEARWSRFLDASETTRITRGAGTGVDVSDETFALLSACAVWSEQTGGAFQPLVGAAVTAWGYSEPIQLEAPAVDAPPPSRPVTGKITLYPARRAVRIPAGAVLDLGGVAKGWMADRAGRVLRRSRRAPHVLLDAGGDMLAARGDHTIAVDHPGRPAMQLTLRPGMAVATSGTTARSWPDGDGGIAHHRIDPATGAPSEHVCVTVVAPTCAEADVQATLLALRPHLIATFALPAAVTQNGETRTSPAWADVVTDG